MKLLILILLINFLFVSAVFAQKEFPTIKPQKTYKQIGVKIVSPNQADWKIAKSENLETSFIKTDSDGKYNAFVKTKTIELFENIEDLFVNLEKMKEEELKNLKRDSLHFNRTNFKETPCLQYDGIFNDKQEENDSEFNYFNFNGYLCRHPSAKNTVIQMEFSNYSNTRGLTETEIKLSKDFFEKIKFSKVENK